MSKQTFLNIYSESKIFVIVKKVHTKVVKVMFDKLTEIDFAKSTPQVWLSLCKPGKRCNKHFGKSFKMYIFPS